MKLCPRCQKQFSDDANFCPVDAARLVPLDAQPTATDALAAKFELGEPLGGGRTGAVHRATDKATGQPAAVKIIAPAVVALPGLAQRLERELKQLERVASSGVARVLGSGKRGDDHWVAMELLGEVETLGDAVGGRGAMPIDKAARLIEIIGEALIEAAQVGVVHRDLAPKNIVFAGDDVKLINFSLPVPTNDKVPGVPEFVAPEQHDGKPVDQRSNLYSLGALYYFVLTGQPVTSDANGVLTLPSALAEVPEEVEAVILRALDRSPTKRFLTVRQFVDEVGRVARGEPGPRSTQPLGKAGKLKPELFQTLIDPNPLGASEGVASAEPERSAWAPSAMAAPPGLAPPVGAPLAVPVASVAAPGVAAPGNAAPGVAAGKASKPAADAKGKFRETMWFKKGELDAQAALAAAEEHARTGKVTADKADALPIDERYKDDGTLSRADKELYSLRGATQTNPAVRDSGGHPAAAVAGVAAGAGAKVSEDALIGEMKAGRSKIFAIIAVALVAVVLLIVLIARF